MMICTSCRRGAILAVSIFMLAPAVSGCEGLFELSTPNPISSTNENSVVEEFRGVQLPYSAERKTTYQAGSEINQKDKNASAADEREALVALTNNNARYAQMLAAASDCEAQSNGFTDTAKISQLDPSLVKAPPRDSQAAVNATCKRVFAEFFRAGLSLSDDVCRYYFHRVDIQFAKLNSFSDATAATDIISSAIMGLSGVGGPIIAGVSTGLGVIDQTARRTVENFIFSPDVYGVYGVVRKKQADLLKEITTSQSIDSISSFYTARSYLHEYNDICSPGRIRDLVNQSMRIAAGADSGLTPRNPIQVDATKLLLSANYADKLAPLFEGTPNLSLENIVYLYFLRVAGLTSIGLPEDTVKQKLIEAGLITSDGKLKAAKDKPNSDSTKLNADKIDATLLEASIAFDFRAIGEELRKKLADIAAERARASAVGQQASLVGFEKVLQDARIAPDNPQRENILAALVGVYAPFGEGLGEKKLVLQKYLADQQVKAFTDEEAVTLVTDLEAFKTANKAHERALQDRIIELVASQAPAAEAEPTSPIAVATAEPILILVHVPAESEDRDTIVAALVALYTPKFALTASEDAAFRAILNDKNVTLPAADDEANHQLRGAVNTLLNDPTASKTIKEAITQMRKQLKVPPPPPTPPLVPTEPLPPPNDPPAVPSTLLNTTQ